MKEFLPCSHSWRNLRSRKSIKYGGTQTQFYVKYSGVINDKFTYNVDTTIGNLVSAFKKSYIDGKKVNVELYHRGNLLSTYPQSSRVFGTLPKDEGVATYNITTEEGPPDGLFIPKTPPGSPPGSPPEGQFIPKSPKSPTGSPPRNSTKKKSTK